MPSVVDICNRALSHTGTDITIASLSEKSKEARLCARWYDSTLEQLLRTHKWGFAQRRVALALIGDGPYGWRFTYRYPVDAITVLQVFSVDSAGRGEPGRFDPRRRRHFETGSDGEGGRTVLTDVENAGCRYTSKIEDPNIMTPDFSAAFELMLAANISMPLHANPAMSQALNSQALGKMNEAISRDQSERNIPGQREAEWTRAHIGGLGDWFRDRDGGDW